MKRVIGRHKAFLKAFAITGSITKAAKAARIDRGQHYAWLREKEGYREAFDLATAEASDLFEDEAKRRAYDGVFEPNIWQGQFCYAIKGYEKDPETGLDRVNVMGDRIPIYGKKPIGVIKYSDSLLTTLLKGLKPERYRDRVSAEVTGKDGGPIRLQDEKLRTLTDDELTQLIAVAKKLAVTGSDGSGSPPAPAE